MSVVDITCYWKIIEWMNIESQVSRLHIYLIPNSFFASASRGRSGLLLPGNWKIIIALNESVLLFRALVERSIKFDNKKMIEIGYTKFI